MVASTPATLSTASHPHHREARIRFASRAALLAGFARAQNEPWIEACRIDLSQLELWVRMAGGFRVPASPAPLRMVPGGRDAAACRLS